MLLLHYNRYNTSSTQGILKWKPKDIQTSPQYSPFPFLNYGIPSLNDDIYTSKKHFSYFFQLFSLTSSSEENYCPLSASFMNPNDWNLRVHKTKETLRQQPSSAPSCSLSAFWRPAVYKTLSSQETAGTTMAYLKAFTDFYYHNTSVSCNDHINHFLFILIQSNIWPTTESGEEFNCGR